MMIHRPNSRPVKAAMTGAALLFGLMAMAPAQALADSDAPGRISLVGIGEVRAVPDEASIAIGVVHQADTAAAALKDNNAAMSEIFATLKGEGIDEKDIQTANFSLNPRYVYPKDNSGPPTIQGYEVSNEVSVRVRDLTKLGALLDKVVQSGSNRINGVSFSLSNPEEAENEARRRAVANAKAKAELYAKAAGVKLGSVRQISEAGIAMPPRPIMRAEAYAVKAAADAVPIANGEQTITIQVNMTWDID